MTTNTTQPVRAVLGLKGGFALQRRVEGRWKTLQEVSTLDQACFSLERLKAPIHETSLRIVERNRKQRQRIAVRASAQ